MIQVASGAIKAQLHLASSSPPIQNLFFLHSSQNKLQTNQGPAGLLPGSDCFGVNWIRSQLRKIKWRSQWRPDPAGNTTCFSFSPYRLKETPIWGLWVWGQHACCVHPHSNSFLNFRENCTAIQEMTAHEWGLFCTADELGMKTFMQSKEVDTLLMEIRAAYPHAT